MAQDDDLLKTLTSPKNIKLIKKRLVHIATLIAGIFAVSALLALFTYEGAPLRKAVENVFKEKPETQQIIAPWEAENAAINSAIDCTGTKITHSSCQDLTSIEEKQNKSNEELATWLSNVVSMSLTMDPYNYQSVMKDSEKYFHSYAYNQYISFLKSNEILENISKGTAKVTTLVTNTPVVITKSVSDNRFKWLVDIPVMITFRSMGYHGETNHDYVLNATLSVQVARYNKPETENLLIERVTTKNVKKTSFK